MAGDDEKKAMRACGAAAIRACLKRKSSRLIIAKTKDRKVGEFHVLANAKQYKKALTEETGFNFRIDHLKLSRFAKAQHKKISSIRYLILVWRGMMLHAIAIFNYNSMIRVGVKVHVDLVF